VTPAAELDVPAQVREQKLEQKVVDFERLDEAGLKEGQWDVVFIACVCLLFLFFVLLLFPFRLFELDRVDRICSSLFVVWFADWAQP
jgi:hypothetical protein